MVLRPHLQFVPKVVSEFHPNHFILLVVFPKLHSRLGEKLCRFWLFPKLCYVALIVLSLSSCLLVFFALFPGHLKAKPPCWRISVVQLMNFQSFHELLPPNLFCQNIYCSRDVPTSENCKVEQPQQNPVKCFALAVPTLGEQYCNHFFNWLKLKLPSFTIPASLIQLAHQR